MIESIRWLARARGPVAGLGRTFLLTASLGALMAAGALRRPLGAQVATDTTAADSLSNAELASPAAASSPSPEKRLPVLVVLGLGYGSRSDDCALCATPQDNKSFTGHLSVIRPLGHGLGVGIDASVWRKGHPGTPAAPGSEGVSSAPALTNTLGNLSVSFSYDVWHLYLRAGGGLAWGSQDLESAGIGANPIIDTASGWGVGYSVGAGITVPLASVVSLAFFGNWNVGHYDMISPLGFSERAVHHRYLEVGAGLAMR